MVLLLSPVRHLRPKLRFLKYTLQGGGTGDDGNDVTSQGPKPLKDWGKKIPPQFFGSRMEKVIAPR